MDRPGLVNVGEPVVPPRAPSFTPCRQQRFGALRRNESGFAPRRVRLPVVTNEDEWTGLGS